MITFINIAVGKRYAGATAHEKRVGNWLKQAGFKDVTFQPNGINNHPDWKARDGKKWIEIECKTSKKSEIMFNDTLPPKETLYVFSSEYHNDTMVFYGGDVFKKWIYRKIDEYKKQSKVLGDRFVKECLNNKRSNPFGFIPGNRCCLRQRGGASSDFFSAKTTLVNKARARNR